MIIYTIDKTDNTKEPARKVTIDFFKQVLGFKDENIIFVDRNEFGYNQSGICRTEFSAETKEAMKKFARSVFGDTQYGLANQILHIAICECQGDDFGASNYFTHASNVELTIRLLDNFTLSNAQEYFDGLR